MGWLRNINDAIRQRSVGVLAGPAGVSPGEVSIEQLFQSIGYDLGKDGIPIMTSAKMLEIPAVWAAVDFLSSTVARLPIYEYDEAGKRRKGSEIEWLLNRRGAKNMTSYKVRRQWMQDALIEGRGCLWAEKGVKGNPINIYPLTYAGMMLNPDGTFKAMAMGGKTKDYKPEEVADLTIISQGGWNWALSPRVRMSRALGLSWAAQDFARTYFAGGGMPQMLAFLRNTPSKAGAYQNVAKDLYRSIRTAQRNQRGILPLPPDIERVDQVGHRPDNTQMQESREFQVIETCRIYGIPPNILQSYKDSATFANVSQQDAHLAKHTITRWTAQMDAELTRVLIGQDYEGNRGYVQTDLMGLLRGDLLTRQQANKILATHGALTPNELREDAGKDRVDDPAGLMDSTWIQTSQAPINDWPGASEPSGGDGMGGDAVKDAVKEAMEEQANGG